MLLQYNTACCRLCHIEETGAATRRKLLVVEKPFNMTYIGGNWCSDEAGEEEREEEAGCCPNCRGSVEGLS